MSNQAGNKSTVSLKRVLGLSALFAVTIAGVCSQSSFVSLLNGAGTGGGSFFIAIFIAFLLTLCYVFSYLELSLMMPKAGGIGTYTAVAGGYFISIGVVLGGYLAVIPFAGPAELMLLERVVGTAYPGVFSHLGLMLLLLLTILNLLGINIFASVQNIIVYTLFVTLFMIGVTGLKGADAKGAIPAEIWQQLEHSGSSIFSLVVLALWSFAGLEFVCPLIEETKRPEKNIPKAMIAGAIMLLVVYSLIAFAGMRQIPSVILGRSEIPHWLLVETLFGKASGFVIVVFAFTATSCTANSIIASVSRMLYGMANQQQLPEVFKKIHPRWNTPWVGILFVAALVAVPLVFLSNAKNFIFLMLISAATLWLMAYIVAHINVMVLRKKYPAFIRPFKTPLYPLPQIIGILGMGYAILNNSPSPEMTIKVYTNAALIVVIVSLYSFFWVRFKMKKKLFETESIDEAIAD